MNKNQKFLVLFSIICFTSCISNEDIESIKFSNIENISLNEDNTRGMYVLHADLVLENERKINFTLTDFNLKLNWKGEVIHVIYDGGVEEIEFGRTRVNIPIKSEISKALITKNLLAVAFQTMLGHKNLVGAKGYIVAKNCFLRKRLSLIKILKWVFNQIDSVIISFFEMKFISV